MRALVVYHHLPHYRRDVFREMDSDHAWEVTFASGPSSSDGSIAVMDPRELSSHEALSNRWLFRTPTRGGALWQRGLAKLSATASYDVAIYLGDASFLSTWVAAAISRVRGKRVAFWTIGWHRPEAGVKRLVRLTFYRLANTLLLYGETAAEIGKAMGYPPNRMAVIYNSAARPPEGGGEIVSAARQGLPGAHRDTVGAVIRLTPSKHLSMVIKAAALLREGGRTVEVLFVGEGPERKELSRLAMQLGVPLSMPGAAYSREELEQAYGRLDVTVVPSAAGLTVIQSLGHGTPVITHSNRFTQMPEFEAIREGVNGSLYSEGDINSLASKMSHWLDEVYANKDAVAARCMDSLTENWNAEAQKRRIFDAVERLAPVSS